jgi:tetratricopeptide (TPR) repeat protein
MKYNSKKLIEIENAWLELKPSYGIVLTIRYLKDFPNDGRAMVFLGYFYTHVRRFSDAILALRRAMRLIEKGGGNIAEVYSAMGFLYKEKGNYRVAERWYCRAIENDPDDLYHYQSLGEILSLQCKFNKAESYFNQVIGSPTKRLKDQAYFELGLIKKSKEKFNDALFLFNKALEFGAEKESVDEEIFDINEALKLMDS